MTRDYFIKLTVALYKVTDLFPKDEPLKYQIRQIANQILALLLSQNPTRNSLKINEILDNINILFGYFDLAKSQNWVNQKNIEILFEEYKKIQENLTRQPQPQTIKEEKERPIKVSKPRQQERRSTPQERQKRVLALLREKKQITLSEIRQIFFQVSQRTLRRDMEDLIKRGIVARKRLGQKDVLYTLLNADTETDTMRSNLQ